MLIGKVWNIAQYQYFGPASILPIWLDKWKWYSILSIWWDETSNKWQIFANPNSKILRLIPILRFQTMFISFVLADSWNSKDVFCQIPQQSETCQIKSKALIQKLYLTNLFPISVYSYWDGSLNFRLSWDLPLQPFKFLIKIFTQGFSFSIGLPPTKAFHSNAGGCSNSSFSYAFFFMVFYIFPFSLHRYLHTWLPLSSKA